MTSCSATETGRGEGLPALPFLQDWLRISWSAVGEQLGFFASLIFLGFVFLWGVLLFHLLILLFSVLNCLYLSP